MTLIQKFIIALLSSILLIAIVNIAWFYLFYSSYLKAFLAEKINAKSEITIDYINSLVEKQSLDDIDNIFSETEINLFDLLEKNNWKIPLNTKENTDIVINYLLKSWVAPKYIEDIVPTNNFEELLKTLKDKNSPEYEFLNKLTVSIAITNTITIILILLFFIFFSRKTILPIREVTKQIKKFSPWKTEEITTYKNKDEIWFLVNAINDLNKKLLVQEWIRRKLLWDISHELKTPITSIQCYLEWIMDWVIKLNDKNLHLITAEMKRLISLVNKIMDYEKFENNVLVLEKSEENLYDILTWVVETHKNKLKTNYQSIKIAWEINLKKLIDKNLFKQLAHNLIGNFLKYAWKNSLLTINIGKNYIDFIDNWIWIKQSEIPYLMEKFYQGNSSKTWKVDERWIWIWLSIVWKIISSHNWTYKIKSDLWKWFSFKIYF